MASWTDNSQELSRFNSYIEQQPVQQMAQIGMQREEAFQQGIQKVQGMYDSLLGADVAKKETQDYIKQKVGQLNNAVQQSVQGDFSDSRLVNQIGGLAGQIANDPIVTNGIVSTAAIKSGFSKMQEAQKSGKSAPQNEQYFQNMVSQWQNDGDVTSTFNGGYTEHVDAIKKFTDLYKDAHPGEDIPDDAFRIENGQVTINPTVAKGMSPAKLQNIWNLVASQPDVQQQFNIDGWAKYRGATPAMMYKSFSDDTNQSLKAIEDSVKTLQAKLASSSGNDSAAISHQIEELKQVAESKKGRFSDLSKGLQTNPDTVKAQLVQEQMGNSLINGFSYQTMEKSPLWETSMEQNKFNLEMSKFKEEQRWHDLQYNKDLLEIQSKADKLAKEKKTGPGEDYIITTGAVNTPQAQGEYTAMQDRDNASKSYVQAQRKLANDLTQGKKPFYLDGSGQYIPNIGILPNQYASEKDVNDATATVLAPARDAYINGKITDGVVADGMRASERAYTDLQNKEQVIKDVQSIAEPQLEKTKASLGTVNIPYDNNGKAINQNDLADVWMVKKDAPNSQAANTRLINKFGQGGAKYIIQESDLSTTTANGFLVTAPGKFQGQYNQIADKLNRDTGLSASLNQIEQEYAKRQTTNIGKVVTYNTNEDKDSKAIANKFGSILDRIKDLHPSGTSGDINGMLSILDASQKDFKGYRFSSSFDGNTAYLRVAIGNDKPLEVTVPKDLYFQVFNDQRVSNEFNNTYGSKLALNRQQYTGIERTEAEVVKMPNTSPYGVQYTLEKNGDGTYNMRLWVTPKGSNTPTIPGMFASGVVPGMPATLSEEDVLNYSKKLQDPNFVQQVLLYKEQVDKLNN